MRTVYLDNAATSWPKPPTVSRAVAREISRGGGNPGRSGHAKAIGAGRTVLRTRELIAELFNIRDPSHIIFTKNATEALNTVIRGLVKSGDKVLTTSMEHNSVMRPLRALCADGVVVSVAEADDNGLVDPKEIEARIEEGTRLVAITHASNVTGTVNDIATIGALCDAKGIPLLVDAAQTAGCIPVDVERMRIDFLAFSGHKGLLGPQGTGGLYVREERRLAPLTRGGTGSLSDREEQPTFLPDMYESGTLNVPGIAGLGEGVAWILSHGVESVRNHDQHLREAFLDALGGQSRMRVFGPPGSASCTGAISLTIDGVSPSLVGELLENRYGILSRIGLHCAPRAHRTIGTYPEGTVRLSWGPFTRERDVRGAANALREISRTGSQLHA